VKALGDLRLTAALVGLLGAVWFSLRWWTRQAAESEGEYAMFEDVPADEVLTLALARNTAHRSARSANQRHQRTDQARHHLS